MRGIILSVNVINTNITKNKSGKMNAVDINQNPPGVEKKILDQKKREKEGRYVRVDERTLLFVSAGKDVKMAISEYNKRVNNRPNRW